MKLVRGFPHSVRSCTSTYVVTTLFKVSSSAIFRHHLLFWLVETWATVRAGCWSHTCPVQFCEVGTNRLVSTRTAEAPAYRLVTTGYLQDFYSLKGSIVQRSPVRKERRTPGRPLNVTGTAFRLDTHRVVPRPSTTRWGGARDLSVPACPTVIHC